MKNPYTKLIKVLDKSNTIIAVRSEDIIYLCNGFFVKALTVSEYNAYLRTAKPYYIDLKDGEELRMTAERSSLPEAKQSTPDFIKSMKAFIDADAPCEVHITPFIDTSFTKGTVRLAVTNNTLVCINDDYLQACGADDLYQSKGKFFDPICSGTAAILPIRYDDNVKLEIKALAGTL